MLRVLSANPGDAGVDAAAEIIEIALHNAGRERNASYSVADLQASAHAHLSRLLNASPAVIYCRRATGDYEPTFVSDSVTRLFGCTPAEYISNPYLWRDRVHPDDVPRINAWVDRLSESDQRSIEYRIRREDGSYFWVTIASTLSATRRACRSRSPARGPMSPSGRRPKPRERKHARDSRSCSARHRR